MRISNLGSFNRHHTLAPSQPEPIITRTSSHTLSPNQAEPILTRSSSYREPSLSNLKRASAEVEVISPSSPLGNRDNMMTFSSSTLPRSHGGSSLEEGRIPRRHASIHASMDSTRSKQLLSQWKNKNDNRKLSLQVMDGIRPTSSSSPQRNMELRCSSEPSAMGLEAELRGVTHLPSTGQETELRAGGHIPAQYMKLAASSVPMANHNHMAHNGSTGLAGGARVSIQSRPGSSQLVHIPEEENPNCRDQESESEDSIMDGGGSVREKWLRVAEKTTIPCRPLSAGGQPRLMQVIALSKQQGLLHSPRSEDGGSTVSCTGSIRYRALTDQDPSPPASTTGAVGGGGLERSGSIVRVEAHPESRSNKPVVKPPSTDGSGSWRWKPPEQRPSLRQSAFTLNDLNRHTDSCDSLRDGGSLDGRRSVTGTETESECGGEGGGGGVYTNHPHVVHPLHPLHPNNPNNFQHPNFNPNNPNFNNIHANFNSNLPFTPTAIFAPPFHPHPQAVTTIRVTPVEGTAASSDGGSDCQSVASSSRESTLRRKSGSNIVHIPDRGPTPDLHNNHRLCDDSNRLDNESSNRFHENLRSFQDNPIHPNHPNRQLQGMFSRPGPTPPPTLPRPILTHTPPPTLGLAYKE
eukprot:superscaffoldBa00001848_g12248